MKKVVVITGPTAVGKTDISIEVAKSFHGEIINADASQFRKNLNIGTAKIDISKVAVPHHLIDILNPKDDFSIKDYQIIARDKIDLLHNKNILPFLVGGSGLYINSVLGDYNLENPGRNLGFEEQYKSFTNEDLHKLLEELDYASSQKIHPNNRRRVLRAIETAIMGNKLSENNEGYKIVYDSIIICLVCERSVLYERINQRVDIMFANGWIEEVIKLKASGLDLKNVKDIGYSEINDYLENKMSLEEIKELIKQKTRNYAKRQITWFNNKMNCVFVQVNYQDIKKTIDEIIQLTNNFIHKNIKESLN